MVTLENLSKNYATLIQEVESGQIKIPQFRRDFVWEKIQSAQLLDSILKGYPIGTFIELVSIAFGFCRVAGRYYHQKVTRIPTGSHGYKGNRFFRKGKDKLEEWLADKLLALDFEVALLRAYR